MSLAVLEAVDVTTLWQALEICKVGRCDLAPSPAATCEGEVEEGAVTQPFQRVIASRDQRVEFVPRDRRLLCRAVAAFFSRAPGTRQTMPNSGLLARVLHAPQLMRFREHGDAMHHGAEFERAKPLLE